MKKLITRRRIMSIFNRIVLSKRQREIFKKTSLAEARFNNIELTPQERYEIRSRWDAVKSRYSLNSYKVFKDLCGFNPNFIANELFYPLFSSTLNPYPYRFCFSNKGYYHFLMPGIRQPDFLMRRANGVYYGKNGIINDNDAKELYLKLGTVFVKPTSNSCQGNGCQLIDTYTLDWSDFLKSCPRNFLIQRPITQSSYTALLNRDSLNCFRVTTLYINGKATAPTVCLKFGTKGRIVDNVGTGGYIVGVNPDGRLAEKAYAADLSSIDNIDGIRLSDIIIPNIQDVIDFAITNHTIYFPDVGLVGWDIALDSDNLPVMIEANIGDQVNYVGVHLEQIASATPIFGDRTQEVIDYILTHPCRHVY